MNRVVSDGAGIGLLSGCGAGDKPVILVVEDEILIRLDLADILRDAGYAVLEAADADEALTLIRAHAAINLVITDVRMPGERDGLDLAREIRARWAGMPVVIASGHWEDDGEQLADGLLPKPYTSEQILSLTKELVNPAWSNKTREPRAS